MEIAKGVEGGSQEAGTEEYPGRTGKQARLNLSFQTTDLRADVRGEQGLIGGKPRGERQGKG